MTSSERPRRRRPASGQVTLRTVADIAGVSPITVSRALRGQTTVDPALAMRVRAVAEQLGYVPDPAARALASHHGTQVLVLVPLLSNALFVELLESVHRILFPAGFQPLIGVTHYDSSEEERLLRGYLPHRPAGLLLTGLDRSEAARALIERSGRPCVHLMELADDPSIACVGFSQREGGRRMTEHLLSRGRRRIAFCAAQLDPRVMQRAAGYREALAAAGLYDPDREYLDPAPSSLALGAGLFEEVMRRQPDTDAIFFCNDDLAQGGLLCATRLGIGVPSRVAVSGFNDLAGNEQMVPPLTSLRTPRSEIGAAGARMLLAMMRGEPVAKPRVELGFELIVRAST